MKNIFGIALTITILTLLSSCKHSNSSDINSGLSLASNLKVSLEEKIDSSDDNSENSSEASASSDVIDTASPESKSEDTVPEVSKVSSSSNLPDKKIVRAIENTVTDDPSEIKEDSEILVYDNNGYAYTYDKYGNPYIVYHQVNNELESYTVYNYSVPENRIISTLEVYDPDKTIKSKRAYSGGKQIEYIHYTNGIPDKIETTEYDANGNITMQEITDGGKKLVKKYVYEFNDMNFPTKTTASFADNTQNYTEVILYDDSGNFLEYHKYDYEGNEVLF